MFVLKSTFECGIIEVVSNNFKSSRICKFVLVMLDLRLKDNVTTVRTPIKTARY